ncbi:alpha/beta hydrolase [Caballeronia sp. LZ032]|uniref:alpha/beta fold hydrolase n=1 Tax=Caballeronia sp. LZ032 TaxID=3038565 RepID=UPI0028624FB6|nr:alpha/beta hydrolase [Caballeronia sp. LZ032]MDR5881577.1 alpha/beta hydrolase [Caballeronia sp. LZ032]
MPQNERLQANGIELHVEVFGSRSDPVALLVMGNSAPGLVWPDRFCEELASAGLCVVRFDARDTGLSTYIDFDTSPYTLDDLAADAFALLDALAVRSAHVIGLSQGGVIGYRMALQRPERLRSLTVMMSSADLRPKNDAFAGVAPRAGELPRPSADYVAQVIALNASAPVTAEERAQRFVDNFRLAAGPRSPFDEAAWLALAHAYAAQVMLRTDGLSAKLANHSHHALAQKRSPNLQADELASLRVPVLLIHGSDDPIFPLEHARWAASVIPGAQLHIVDAMGHALDPAFFAPVLGALGSFYARLDREPASA